MDTRILELIKNPETIKVEDINLLETEIEKLPYVQSLRAIYLLGIHRFYNENFQKELTKTAAYTTDKRILYNFINRIKKDEFSLPEKHPFITKEDIIIENTPTYETSEQKSSLSKEENIVETISTPPTAQQTEFNNYVAEELTKLKADNNTQTPVNQNVKPTPPTAQQTEFNNYVAEELAKLKANENAQIEANQEAKSTPPTAQQTEFNNYVAEELAKLKANENAQIEANQEAKSTPPTAQQTEFNNYVAEELAKLKANENAQIETNQEAKPTLLTEESDNEQVVEILENKSSENQETITNENVTDKYIYGQVKSHSTDEASKTPIDFYTKKQLTEESSHNEITTNKTSAMDYYSNPKRNVEKKENNYSTSSPISFYERPIQSSEKTGTKKEESLTNQSSTTISETQQDWKPMDFYSSKPTIKTEEKVEENKTTDTETKIETVQKQNIYETKIDKEVENKSNVTSFINTWKNWLKIDRTPKAQPSEQDRKSAIIDKFIENNPKISPIKEEVDFVVKERGDDISHLMTETLAQLYLEQKLYTKAINAYKILQEKHPEKSEEFSNKIDEIKKSRNMK